MGKSIKAGDLTNLEKLVLLGLDDKGWFGNSENTIKFGLVGMIIYELFAAGKINFEGKRIMVESTEPFGDTLEDKVLSVISKEKKTRSINSWIQRLAYRKLFLRKVIIKKLIDLDIISKEEFSMFWVFYQNKYPLVNPDLKREVQNEIFGKLHSNDKISASSLMFLSIMESCGFLKKNLKGRADSTLIHKRIHDLLNFPEPLTKKAKLVRQITQGMKRAIVASRVSIHV
jgi:hypothetical protein